MTERDGDAVHIWLVHGTFETNASWADPETSPLCARMREALAQRSHLHRFLWSGNNRHVDRMEAGERLCAEILDVHRNEPRAALFAIGHSHGGTVITHALRNSPQLGQVVTGFGFLSTPFIQLVPRVHAVAVGAVLFLSLLLIGVGVGLLFRHERGLTPFGVQPQWYEWAKWSAFALIAMTAWIWERVSGGADAEVWLRARLSAIQREFEIVHLASDKTLLIRAQADEASMGLTFVHALSRVLGEFVGRVAAALTLVVPVLWDRRQAGLAASTRWPRKLEDAIVAVIMVVVLAAIIVGALLLLGGAVDWLIGWFDLSIRKLIEPHAPSMLVNWDALAALSDGALPWIAAGALVLGLIGTTMLLLLALLFGILGRAFGRWFFLPGLFMEIFVESTPPGRWTVLQLHAPDQADAVVQGAGVTLTHSLSHSDPNAHRALAQWIATLACNHVAPVAKTA